MLSPKRFHLVLAVILAASSLIFLVSAYYTHGAKAESQSAETTLRLKVLRRKDRLHLKPNAAEIASLRKQDSAQEERKVEDKIPKHVPLKIKLKADKEKAFKDFNNSKWYRDFELEVTNTSDKPVYFLELWLVYPEIIDNGRAVGVPLRYGRMNFIYQDTRPLPTDVPIQPGDT